MPFSSGTYNTSTITYDQSSLAYDGYPAPLSGMPAVGVFVAWTGTPYEVNPTGGWTEISQYVRQITIRRGRQDDLQQFPPGAAQLVLDNNLRYFDPFNTSAPAPFNGNLVPRKQIKIVANWNGAEYPLYRGYVAGWPVEYADGGTDSTVTIDCFDLLGLAATETTTPDLVSDTITSFSPTHYWKVDDKENQLTIKDRGSYLRDLTVNQVSSAYPKLTKIPAMAEGLLTSAGVFPDEARNAGTAAQYPATATSVSFGGWFMSRDAKGGTAYRIYLSGNTSNAAGTTTGTMGIQVGRNTTFANDPGRIVVFVSWGASTAVCQSATTFYGETNVGHFIVCTYDYTAGTIKLYVDGIDVTATATNIASLSTAPYYSIAIGDNNAQEVFMVNRVLSSDEVSLIYQMSTNRYPRTYTNANLLFLNSSNIPSAFWNIQPDDTTYVSVNQTSDPLLPTLRKIVTSENGELFVDVSGVMQIFNGTSVFDRTRSNTSQVTFTDTGVGVEYDASVVRLDFNADQVRNDVTVIFTEQDQYNVTDATSTAAYGVAAQSFSVLQALVSDGQALANRFLTIYKNPKMTLEPFMSKGQQDPTYNWPRLLGLELLDRVTFKRTPATGSAIVKDLLVQSIEHRITPGEWQTVVNGSARYTNWFIVGVSLIGGDDLLLN